MKRLELDWGYIDALLEKRGIQLYDLKNGSVLYKSRRSGLRTTRTVDELAHQLGVDPMRLLRTVESVEPEAEGART